MKFYLLIDGILITATIILAISLMLRKATVMGSGYLLKELVKPDLVFQAFGISLDADDTICLWGAEITIADHKSDLVLDRHTG